MKAKAGKPVPAPLRRSCSFCHGRFKATNLEAVTTLLGKRRYRCPKCAVKWPDSPDMLGGPPWFHVLARRSVL